MTWCGSRTAKSTVPNVRLNDDIKSEMLLSRKRYSIRILVIVLFCTLKRVSSYPYREGQYETCHYNEVAIKGVVKKGVAENRIT